MTTRRLPNLNAAETTDRARAIVFITVCQGAYADKYYRDHCRDLGKRLHKAAVSEGEIRREMVSFQDAVQHDLWALSQKQNSGAAA